MYPEILILSRLDCVHLEHNARTVLDCHSFTRIYQILLPKFSHIVSAKWDLAAAALHGARALSDTAGAHGSLSIPVYHSIDLATDNYRWITVPSSNQKLS